MNSAMNGATTAPTESKPAASREATIVQSFAVLLAFQCLGELIAYVPRVPIPGPVNGMVLFLGVLCALPAPALALARRVDYVSPGLLNNLSLLFVPARVSQSSRPLPC